MNKKQLKVHFKTLIKQNPQHKKQLGDIYKYAKNENVKAIAMYIQQLPKQSVLDVVELVADLQVEVKDSENEMFLLDRLEVGEKINKLIENNFEGLDAETKQKLNNISKKIMQSNSKDGFWNQSVVTPWANLYVSLNKDRLFPSQFFEELAKLENFASQEHLSFLQNTILAMTDKSKQNIDALIEFFEQQKISNKNFVEKIEPSIYKNVLIDLQVQDDGSVNDLAFYMWDKITNLDGVSKHFLNIEQLTEDMRYMNNEQKTYAITKLFVFSEKQFPHREKTFYNDFLQKATKGLSAENFCELAPILDSAIVSQGQGIAGLINRGLKSEHISYFTKQEQKLLSKAQNPEERETLIKNIILGYSNYGYIAEPVWEKTYEIAQKTVKNLTFEQFKERVIKNKNIKEYLEFITENKITYNFDGAETEDVVYYEFYNTFAEIFPKTRFQEFPEKEIVGLLTKQQLQNFNLKTYKKFLTTSEFSHTREAKIAFVDFASVMGLFETDEEVDKRIDMAYKLIAPGQFGTYQILRLHQTGIKLEEMLKHFDTSTQNKYLIKADIKNEELRTFFNNYATGGGANYDDDKYYKVYQFSETELKQLKSMTGDLGKKINDFLSPYKKVAGGYELKRGVVVPEDLKTELTDFIDEETYKNLSNKDFNEKFALFLNPLEEKEVITYIANKTTPKEYIDELNKTKQLFIASDQTNSNLLHEMFDGLDKTFDKNFYNFLIKYWDYAKNYKNRARLKDVQKVYTKALAYYKKHGNDSPTYFDVLTYINNSPFAFSYGNKEFSAQAKNSGVGLQTSYAEYEKMLPKLEERKLTTIPRHNKTYECTINGKTYRVCAKILRLDDPTTMLVGESKFTNCCQKYGGAGQKCMEHSALANNGGILATYLVEDDGSMKMLTQSWVWTNEQVLCLDNVEATSAITSGSNKSTYQQVAKFAIGEFGKDILSFSEKNVEMYCEEKQRIAKSTLSGEELKNRLKEIEEIKQRQTLRMVTVGEGYDDVNITETFKEKAENIAPKGYEGYRDSHLQYVVAKSNVMQVESSEKYEETPIYRDERRTFAMQGKNITQKMLKHITDIESLVHKKHMVMYKDDNNPKLIEPKDLAAINECALSDLKVMAGEDWYIVYSDNGTEIEIYDMAKTLPRLEDEAKLQQKEMMSAFKNILESAVVCKNGQTNVKTINADLREDTSYLLYLFQLKHGLVEQVGEDLKYDYEQSDKKTPLCLAEQFEILKNAKQVRENADKEKTTMHKICFKPSQKVIDNIKQENEENKEM
ncbi:MAG: hypothetical protein IJA69_02850 [Clostridia bacterium]|nr:hypothetical protein [Clostridia bacterium]